MIHKRQRRSVLATIAAPPVVPPVVLAVVPVVLAVVLLAAGVTAARSATLQERAHAAHTLRATDIAHLRYVSASGSLLYEIGQATGTLPGTMRVHLRVSSTFSGTFTIYTRGGS